MKWKNKGHEFDELGALFQKNSEILVIGNKNDAEKIYKQLEFLNTKISTFTDINILDLGHGLKKRIKQIKTKFLENILKNKTIILANSIAYNNRLITILTKLKLKEKINYFREEEFFNKFLSIYAVYVSDKVYFPSNCFICTTVCTLNCRDCLNFAPYDKHKTHYDLERLKSDVDTYFKCIDRVGLFHISGGEPFSYPHIKELIEYIGENYRDQIDILGTVTNGTLLPSDNLCKVIQKYDVRVEIDDYTISLPHLKENINKLKNKLTQFNIDIQTNIATTFYELFPPKEITPQENLCKKFDACNQIYQELKNGKLYTCNWAEFAYQAGILTEINDYYDLNNFIATQDKKELIEYRLGFNAKGYVDFCRYCNGNQNINKHFVPAAIQAKGYLEWDINNPTEVRETNTIQQGERHE